MTVTTNLALPLIAAAQAQKHVTHNEALLAIDALLGCAVKDKDLTAPPSAPAEGDRYIVAAAPTGAWAGKATNIAAWQDGIWRFYAPRAGFIAFVTDELQLYHYDGAAWAPGVLAITNLQNLALLGLGTTADATNPFSTKLNNVLHAANTVAEGGTGNIQVKLSKESAAKTASYLFQNNFSGRAEFGLAGDDDFHVKVSANGAAWTEAVVVNRSTGSVSLPAGATTPTPAAGDSTTKVATTAFVSAATAALVNSSPAALDTLKELADALGNDPNFATTVTNALAAKAPLASPALTGTPTAPTPAAGDSTTKLATTAFVAAAAVPQAGQCRLVKSGANLILQRLNGSRIVINGVPQTIPSAGVLLAPAGLTAGTTYYVYAYMNAGTMALEASLTTRATDATSGMEVKSGDASRTLVGMVRVIPGPAFADTAQQRLVRPWFNRPLLGAGIGIPDRTSTNTAAYQETSSADRIEFLIWADENTSPKLTAWLTGTVSATLYAGIMLDGLFRGGMLAQSAISAGVTVMLKPENTGEGYHYYSPALLTTGGTVTMNGSGYSNLVIELA
jgi:hypothetical protein